MGAVEGSEVRLEDAEMTALLDDGVKVPSGEVTPLVDGSAAVDDPDTPTFGTAAC